MTVRSEILVERLVDLTTPEQTTVAALAAELTSGLTDDPSWVASARNRANHLPAGLRAAVRDFRYDPGPFGWMLVHGLPLHPEQLPDTPTVPGSVERHPTAPAAILAMVTSLLGELTAYRPEKTGALVQNVVPVRGQERSQSNAGSTDLTMHVENAFHHHRPDYVALLCLRNDHDDVAGLRLASIRRAAPLLDERTRRTLSEPEFITEPPPSFQAEGLPPVRHAVLSGDPEDPDVLIDFAATRALSVAGERAMQELDAAFDAVTDTVVLRPGDLAVVDNRVTMHGRTSFRPRFDGRDRWLQRAFILLNFRRAGASRIGGGHVLA